MNTSIKIEAYIDDIRPDELSIVALCSKPKRVRLTTLSKHARTEQVLVEERTQPKPAHAMITGHTKTKRVPEIAEAEVRMCSNCLQRIPYAILDRPHPKAAQFCANCGAPLKGEPPATRKHVQ